MKKSLHYFSKVVKFLKLSRVYPNISIVAGASHNPEIIIKGKKYLTFCSNNYLGLAGNKEAAQAVIDGVKKYGVGSGSTRLLSGTIDVQVELEKKISQFMGVADAITFSSGFLANAGVIRMLVDPFPYNMPLPFMGQSGIIFSDEINHASIIDSVRLAHAEREVYKHNDLVDLEKRLNKHRKKRKLIITDGVFSMDGDFADLKTITRLAKEYDALIYVDDSHGTGVLGAHGEGVCHYLGVNKDVDVIMGSFTKAWGSIGGFITTASVDLSEYLRVTARSYIFSDPILPCIVAGLIKSLELIRDGDDLRKKTMENASYLRKELKNMGFDVLGADFMPIVPPLMRSEKNAMAFSDKLLDAGILAPPVRRPAVTEGQERLRLTTMATHTRDQIDYLLDNMAKIGKQLKMIK